MKRRVLGHILLLGSIAVTIVGLGMRSSAEAACSKCLGGFCLDDANGRRQCRVVKGKSAIKCKAGGDIDLGPITRGKLGANCEFEGSQECEDIGSCAGPGGPPACDPTIMSCLPGIVKPGFGF